jgi:hypothetical protein
VNFADYGMQLSRTSHAIKVWLSIQYFGLAAFRDAIDRCLDLTAYAEERIRQSSSLELMSEASLSVVCFRRRFPSTDEDEIEARNSELVRSLARTRVGFVSSTKLRGRFAIRLCVFNHTTRKEDVDAVLDHFERATRTDEDVAPVVAHRRDPPVEEGWLGAPRVDLKTVRRLPLFAGLDERQVERVARMAREVRVPAGVAIVQQWQVGREFFVIVEGTARILKDGTLLDIIGPGDFFGELAALEWGASFSYPRLATVLATTPVRALTLPGPFFNELVRDAPTVGTTIRAAVPEHLPRM